jgi:tRNA (adenine22-N1)-methyltransferase
MPSQRLQVISSMCPDQGDLVDIGSDHGQLPQLLLKRGFSASLYATELSRDSFQHLKQQLIDLPVKVYQADGLSQLPKGITTVVISGMGGQLIQSILETGKAYLRQIQTLILGPQRDQESLRSWLMKHHWRITDEGFILEEEKAYPIIKVNPGTMQLQPIELAYGPINIQRRDKQFVSWLKQEAITLRKTLTFHKDDHKRQRLEWIETYVKDN